MVVKNKNNKSFWIGSPIAKNQPHNFFKTNPKDYPSYMFRDNDRDGVANVFDCKPNNPYDQGIIDAIITAGKAVFKGESVKKGWRQGMETPSYVSRFKKQREAKREAKIQTKRQLYEALEKTGAKSIESVRSTMGHKAAKKYAEALERQKLYAMNVRREKEGLRSVTPGELRKVQNPEVMAARVKEQAKLDRLGDESHIASPFMAYGLPVTKPGKKAFEYAYKRFYEGKVPIYKEGKIVGYEKGNIIERARRRTQEGTYSPHQRHVIRTMKKTAQSLYPAIPKGATTVVYGVQSKKDRMSGRGRPRGSVKYSIQGRPVGVFEYRRWLSSQRQVFRQQLRQQQELQRMARIQSRMPQYEQVQPQQLPQEMQGQGVTPEYSQYQQVVQEQPQQVQYQYPTQEMPQEEQKRPIATVFKSSGGSPYPPVESQPLTPTRETVPQGYVETVDSFTGRRFIKQLPRKENWM